MTIQLRPNTDIGTTTASTGGALATPTSTATEQGGTMLRVQEAAAVVCACCNTKIAELRGNTLTIRARHHGREHVTQITLVSLPAHEAA